MKVRNKHLFSYLCESPMCQSHFDKRFWFFLSYLITTVIANVGIVQENIQQENENPMLFLDQMGILNQNNLVKGQKLIPSFCLFQHCFKYGKLHVPLLLIICGNINHLLLVVNSSVNMIIYVCLGRRFRDQLRHLATEHLGCGSSCFESCVLAHELDVSVSQPVRFL